MSQLSMMPVLPLDIIENIVDILVNDSDGKDLRYVKAFSVVCQSFLPFCRKHIFSSVRIKLESISSLTELQLPIGEAFEQLLSETPVIAKYVRQLNIRIVQEPHSWSEYSFDQVPPQLTGLQSLTISFWSNASTYSGDWNDLSPSIQCSLLTLMHLPTLTHLGLTDTRNFPIFHLTTCTNLKHLSIKNLDITAEHDTGASLLLQKPIQLHVLDIEIKESQTLRLLAAKLPDGRPVLDFSGLEKMHIGFDFDWSNAAAPTREIFRRAQQLRHIRLAVEVEDADFRVMEFATTITPSLQTLRRLELKIDNFYGLNDPLAGLCDELEDISGRNKLECIEIQVSISTDQDEELSPQWGKLEKVLLKSGWPMLTHVSLDVIPYIRSRRPIDGPFRIALKRLPQTQFTGLMSSKNLDFRFSVNDFVV